MTKTLNQIFFSSTKIRIFFSATLGIFEKKHNPPPLEVKWSVPKWIQKNRKRQKEERTSAPCPLSWNIYVKKQCRHINRAGYNNVCELIDYRASTVCLYYYPTSSISAIFRPKTMHVHYYYYMNLLCKQICQRCRILWLCVHNKQSNFMEAYGYPSMSSTGKTVYI